FLSIVGIALAPAMLRMMNTPSEIVADSTLYLRVYFSGLLFTFVYNIGSSILRAIGDSRTPLYILIACCIVNIVLD
ncbi:MATE family efflux transporter, partial [Eubacterium callanderi]